MGIASTPNRSSIQTLRRRVEAGRVLEPDIDDLAIEDPLEVVLILGVGRKRRRVPFTLTMRTPGSDEDLVAGLLFSEGIIRKADDILSVEWERADDVKPPVRAVVELRDGLEWPTERVARQSVMHASCGVCGSGSLAQLTLARSLRIQDDLVIEPGLIHLLPGRMADEQRAFQQTGGLHASALFDADGSVLIVREDIGRHNALDKLIGAALKSGRLPAHGKLLCVSGRMSYEIIQKALMSRIPVIAGVGAPSSLAVTLAVDFDLTLVGFVKPGRYNIYSGEKRLKGR